MAEHVTITTPVGRFVSGSITQGFSTDSDGNPLLIKNGLNKGQPRTVWNIGIAIPKVLGQPWQQTEWGKVLIQVARTSFPNSFDQAGNLLPGRQFAFKVADGDSTVPNSRGNINAEKEGWAGHWVLFWANGSAPKTYNRDGTAEVPNDSIKPGYFIQIFGEVKGNESTQNPGLFLNHRMIALSAYGEEIDLGVYTNPAQAGFGAAPLPTGASDVPPAGLGTQQTPPPAPGASVTPPPASDLVTPPPAPGASVTPPPAPPAEERYEYNGTVYTKSQLLGFPGWTEAHLVNLKKV